MSTDPPPITTAYTSVTAHLTDTAAVPLLSTSTSNSTTLALTTLSTTFLSSNETLSRLGFGAPLRVTTTTRNGRQVFQSYLPCPSAVEEDGERPTVERTFPPSALVATIVTPRRRDHAEAMRAKDDLEGLARTVQDEWRGPQLGEGRRADGLLPNGQ